jgi:hypothetical protein
MMVVLLLFMLRVHAHVMMRGGFEVRSDLSCAALERRPVTRGVLGLTKDLSLEVLEGDHDHGHIVKGLSIERVLKDALNCKATLLMNVLGKFLILVVNRDTVPDTGTYIVVVEFVEDAIAT